MLFTAGVTLLANLAAYFSYRKFKQRKVKHKLKEYEIAFSRYCT